MRWVAGLHKKQRLYLFLCLKKEKKKNKQIGELKKQSDITQQLGFWGFFSLWKTSGNAASGLRKHQITQTCKVSARISRATSKDAPFEYLTLLAAARIAPFAVRTCRFFPLPVPVISSDNQLKRYTRGTKRCGEQQHTSFKLTLAGNASFLPRSTKFSYLMTVCLFVILLTAGLLTYAAGQTPANRGLMWEHGRFATCKNTRTKKPNRYHTTMNTQTRLGTHARKLQAPLSGIFHSTVTQIYSIHLQCFLLSVRRLSSCIMLVEQCVIWALEKRREQILARIWIFIILQLAHRSTPPP